MCEDVVVPNPVNPEDDEADDKSHEIRQHLHQLLRQLLYHPVGSNVRDSNREDHQGDHDREDAVAHGGQALIVRRAAGELHFTRPGFFAVC